MIPNADTGKHKGYGFIEFEEHEAATQAIAVSEAWGSGAGVQVRLAVVGMEARRCCRRASMPTTWRQARRHADGAACWEARVCGRWVAAQRAGEVSRMLAMSLTGSTRRS